MHPLCNFLQIRDVKDIAGSVKQTLKDLDVDSLNLCLLPASGSMDLIRVKTRARDVHAMMCTSSLT